MPNRDGTGPAGNGKLTGRGLGPCNTGAQQGRRNPRRGFGLGRGPGMGRGMGRGLGRRGQ